jgi:hypothetical protein
MLGLESAQTKLFLASRVAWKAYETQVQAQVLKKKQHKLEFKIFIIGPKLKLLFKSIIVKLHLVRKVI